jgi:hypothetical protein
LLVLEGSRRLADAVVVPRALVDLLHLARDAVPVLEPVVLDGRSSDVGHDAREAFRRVRRHASLNEADLRVRAGLVKEPYLTVAHAFAVTRVGDPDRTHDAVKAGTQMAGQRCVEVRVLVGDDNRVASPVFHPIQEPGVSDTVPTEHERVERAAIGQDPPVFGPDTEVVRPLSGACHAIDTRPRVELQPVPRIAVGDDLGEAVDQSSVLRAATTVSAGNTLEALAVDAEAVLLIVPDRTAVAVERIGSRTTRDFRESFQPPPDPDIRVQTRSRIPEAERWLHAGATGRHFDRNGVLRRPLLGDAELPLERADRRGRAGRKIFEVTFPAVAVRNRHRWLRGARRALAREIAELPVGATAAAYATLGIGTALSVLTLWRADRALFSAGRVGRSAERWNDLAEVAPLRAASADAVLTLHAARSLLAVHIVRAPLFSVVTDVRAFALAPVARIVAGCR